MCDVRRAAMDVWLVGCLATFLFESKEIVHIFVRVCTIYFICLKIYIKVRETKVISIGSILRSVKGSFETLKHDTYANPNAVIYTKNT